MPNDTYSQKINNAHGRGIEWLDDNGEYFIAEFGNKFAPNFQVTLLDHLDAWAREPNRGLTRLENPGFVVRLITKEDADIFTVSIESLYSTTGI